MQKSSGKNWRFGRKKSFNEMNSPGLRQNKDIHRRNSLVTGGGGFLGSAIVKLLLDRGDKVSSFSRSYYPELSALGVDQIQGDIADRQQVLSACKDREVIFHVAAKPGIWGKYEDYYSTNVIGTGNVISACLDNAVPFLIYTSSPAVVFNGKNMEGVDESVPLTDNFHSHYQKTKSMAEIMVREATGNKLKTVILRPHLIWGPGDNHLVPRIIQRGKSLFRVGSGKNLVDTTYIDNAAAAHVSAADTLADNPSISGNTYFISQGEPVLLWDMINNILRAADLDPVTRTIPQSAAWWIGLFLEIIYKALHLSSEPKMTRFLAEELSTSHWFDISAAKKDLGYQPKVSIEEGLIRLEKWLSH